MTEEQQNELVSSVRDPYFFHIRLKRIVEEFGLGVSFEEYKDIVQTLERKSSTAKKLYEIQKSTLINEVHQDIDHLWDTSKLAEKYNEITRLLNKAKGKPDKTAWRPITGNCDNHLRAYRIKHLKEKKEQLEKLVKNQNEVQCLTRQQLENKRSLIKKQLQIISEVEAKIGEFNNIYLENNREVDAYENIL